LQTGAKVIDHQFFSPVQKKRMTNGVVYETCYPKIKKWFFIGLLDQESETCFFRNSYQKPRREKLLAKT